MVVRPRGDGAVRGAPASGGLRALFLVDQYVIVFDLPDIDPDALDIDVERDMLTVRQNGVPCRGPRAPRRNCPNERSASSLRAAFDRGRAASPTMSPLGRRDGRSWTARQGAEPLIRSRGE